MVLSGPDGGICAHEPPPFRLPAEPVNRPTANGEAMEFFAGAPAQYLETDGPFTIGLASAGGFSAVFMLKMRNFPPPGTLMRLFTLRGAGGLEIDASILPSDEITPTESRPKFTYRYGATMYQSTGVIAVLPGVSFTLAFRYKHSTYDWEIFVDGVPQGNAGDAVRPSPPPPLPAIQTCHYGA